MSLKTLKDINLQGTGVCGEVDSSELKQAVIEWIKSPSPMLNDCDDAVADWIKHFFNLKESDLKWQ